MFGILLIAKPLGITSHDVVNQIRRKFGTRRVGHAGTLDPLATGLLVVAVGPATRFLQYLPLEPKSYIADITFGSATNTYDREGEVTLTGEIPPNLADVVEQHLPLFRGLIQQVPPMYSAVKVKGRALYEYARTGTEVARDPRTVHIAEFKILSVEGSSVRAQVTCSGGTYIRSLANDLGAAMGCYAHLGGLVRNAVGRFRLDEAIPLDEVGPEHLIPLREALPPMPLLKVDEWSTAQIREGRQLEVEEIPTAELVALLEPGGSVFCICRVTGNRLQPECVIPAEAALDGV